MKPGEINIQNYTDFIKNAKERFDPKKAKARTNFEAGSGFIKKFKKCEFKGAIVEGKLTSVQEIDAIADLPLVRCLSAVCWAA